MQLIDSKADVDGFFTKLSLTGECVLLLDYDGTLAPFQIERDRAFPYPGVQEVLRQISVLPNTRLVIVTGRPANEVTPLLGLEHQPEIWGSHGWERLLPNGSHQVMQPHEWAQQDLDLAYGRLLALACSRLRGILAIGRHVERKLASLALHWRGCPPAVTAEIRDSVAEEWRGLAQYTGLKLCPFEEGVELCVPGRTKADAVETIIEETGEDAAVAYLGDDLTDEDAFQSLKGKGLSALVRSEARPSAADLWIRPSNELLQFLWLWEDLRRYPVGAN
ncbi:MAG: trehalose-phosphatase [Gammaproteobacteria bacterium]